MSMRVPRHFDDPGDGIDESELARLIGINSRKRELSCNHREGFPFLPLLLRRNGLAFISNIGCAEETKAFLTGKQARQGRGLSYCIRVLWWARIG
jgi:hypothetical protein